MGIFLHVANFLGSALLGNVLPGIIDYFKRKQDNAHELALGQLQLQMQKEGASQKLEAISAQGDADAFLAAIQAQKVTGDKWADRLTMSVRPGITWLVVIAYVAVKVHRAIKGDVTVWAEEDSLFVENIVGYWFGQRTHKK